MKAATPVNAWGARISFRTLTSRPDLVTHPVLFRGWITQIEFGPLAVQQQGVLREEDLRKNIATLLTTPGSCRPAEIKELSSTILSMIR